MWVRNETKNNAPILVLLITQADEACDSRRVSPKHQACHGLTAWLLMLDNAR